MKDGTATSLTVMTMNNQSQQGSHLDGRHVTVADTSHLGSLASLLSSG